MVWSAPIMANNLKNKVTLKVRLFRRLSEVLLRRFVASPVKSVMPSTSSLCKCRIIILNNHKYSSFFYEYVRLSLYNIPPCQTMLVSCFSQKIVIRLKYRLHLFCSISWKYRLAFVLLERDNCIFDQILTI